MRNNSHRPHLVATRTFLARSAVLLSVVDSSLNKKDKPCVARDDAFVTHSVR